MTIAYSSLKSSEETVLKDLFVDDGAVTAEIVRELAFQMRDFGRRNLPKLLDVQFLSLKTPFGFFAGRGT